MLRVELPIRRCEQPFDDLTVLALPCRSRQAAQPAGRVEIRHARALEEDLLDVGPGDQVRQGPEVGDRPQDPADHLARVAEGNLVPEMRAALVLVDRAMHLGLDLVEVAFRPEPPPLDADERIAADAVIGVGANGHRATAETRRRFPPPRARGADADGGNTLVASSATALAYGPYATRVPDQAAASTRGSCGRNTRLAGSKVRWISCSSSAFRNASRGARLIARWIAAPAFSARTSPTQPSKRVTPTGVAGATPMTSVASPTTARLMPYRLRPPRPTSSRRIARFSMTG